MSLAFSSLLIFTCEAAHDAKPHWRTNLAPIHLLSACLLRRIWLYLAFV